MEKIYCKICGKHLTSNDKYLNKYKICIECLEKDKLKSISEQIDKRGIK